MSHRSSFMRSIALGWIGVLVLSLQFGCCGIRTVDSCGNMSGTGCGSCDGLGVRGGIASRLAGIHCTSGCGEVYWDEQINEPPVCDPCGCGNEFTGQTSCGRCPGALHRFRQLWGAPYMPSDCSTCGAGYGPAGCDSCGSGCSSCQSQSYASDEVYSDVVSSPNEVHAGPMETVPARPAPTIRSQPTPAKPKAVPTPVPDANTQHRAAPKRIPAKVAVGSGAPVRTAQYR